MSNITVISRKTPKTKRPIEKKVYAISSSARKTPYELKKNKKCTIGRATKNTISFKGGTVSEVHASIRWDKSSFKIKDENSTNGTFVNGKRIGKVTILKSGDKIKVGQFVLTFTIKMVREKIAVGSTKARRKTVKKKASKKKASKKKAAKKKTTKKKTAKKKTTKKKTAKKKTTKAGRTRKSTSRKNTARKGSARRTKKAKRKPARKPFQYNSQAVTRIRF